MATVYCDNNQSIDFFITKFKRLVGKEHILIQYKEHQHFKSKSEKRKDKATRAAKRIKKRKS